MQTVAVDNRGPAKAIREMAPEGTVLMNYHTDLAEVTDICPARNSTS